MTHIPTPEMAANVAYLSPEGRLQHIAALLKKGDKEPPTTVRNFLGWFGAQKRGYWKVQRIRKALEDAGLRTDPDFDAVFIDAPISFVLAPQVPPVDHKSVTVIDVEVSDGVVFGDHATGSVTIADPTYRIGKLSAANKAPVSVKPDDTVKTAITLMLSHDYSQLPIMTNERTVKGIISWRSIGARWALDRDGQYAREFVEYAPEIAADRSLFSAIPTIIEHGFILVRDATNRVSGIVTASDLSEQFQQLAEPFLLLGEIENHVRRLIDQKFGPDDLKAVKEPDDPRPIETVADLTFGQYVRLLKDSSRWAKLGLAIDRQTFTRSLDDVRIIRNDVMHFDPDGIADQDLGKLRRFAKFLQSLQAFGA